MSADGGPMLGGGGFFNSMGPSGQYGMWPSCGCTGILMVLAGMLLVCAGGLRILGIQ